MFELIRSLHVDAETGLARGRAQVGTEHPFLADHFPGVPLLPGSLQIELCAQVAGPLSEAVVGRRTGGADHSAGTGPAAVSIASAVSFLGMVRQATFLGPVHLPAELAITAEVRSAEASHVAVTASLGIEGGVPLCRCELVMVLREPEPAWTAAIEGYRARLARWRSGS